MSLFDTNLIEIKLYYTFKDRGNYKKLVILENEKAETLLNDEDKSKSKGIESLTTKWAGMTWKEQQDATSFALTKTNPMTGDKIFDHIAYRDAIIKRCLKEWDIAEGFQPVPVTPVNIDRLPAEIVSEMFTKFESTYEYNEEELKN